MKQSRLMSFIESTINILVGFGISLAAQWFFLPLLGVAISFSQNIVFALIMTVISIARSYILRRVFEALHIRNPLSPGALAIVAERRRQIEQEGWTPESDLVRHQEGDLAQAGACYALSRYATGVREHPGKLHYPASDIWPWDAEWWKPTTFRRDLVKAGALVLAELDRHDAAPRKRQASALRRTTVTLPHPGDA